MKKENLDNLTKISLEFVMMKREGNLNNNENDKTADYYINQEFLL